MAHEHHSHSAGDEVDGKALDPICGMTVDKASAQHRADYDGDTYYFCCAGCRTKFLEAPEDHLRSAGALDPICGMTVDPATARHQAEHEGETYYFC
jgi:Cu+-exporting ATPase